MTKAALARRDGDAFQSRVFWWKAAYLLDDDSPISRVGFEVGPKGFDDIWVQYDSAKAPTDDTGRPIYREYLQCKWHMHPGTWNYRDLVDPDFIGGSARSLLQRAYAAQELVGFQDRPVLFKLVTNWRTTPGDPFQSAIRTRSRLVDVGTLFRAKTDGSATGRVRKLWRDHLQISDTRLRALVKGLAFGEETDSLDEIRAGLDPVFRTVGLKRVPAKEPSFVYDDIFFQWLSQDKVEFDSASFRDACREAGLLDKPAPRQRTYGVKTFEHPVDRLEDRSEEVLDLVPLFDDRFIRRTAYWQSKIYPELRSFLLRTAKGTGALRLALDTHATVALAAGSVLDTRVGRVIELEQRTIDRRVWSTADLATDSSWPQLASVVERLQTRGKGLAVSVGLSHDIVRDVKTYVRENLPGVANLLSCVPSTGPSRQSVKCGQHALELAEAVTAAIRTSRESDTPIHVFVAAPNSFAFFLGQQHRAIGPLQFYEFDFDGSRNHSYMPSLTLPLPK